MKNQPLVITKNVNFNSVGIRSFWDVIGDEHYINLWPRDRRLPYRENTLVIIYTEKGNGIINLKTKEEIRIRGNSLIFLDPHTIHCYRCDGLIWKLYWIEINSDPETINRIPKQKVIQIDNHRHFAIQFEELLDSLQKQKVDYNSYAAAIFNKIFYEWLLTVNNEQKSKSYNSVQSVIEEMHHRLSDNWQVREMALFIGCSEQHLRKLFLNHTGKSPKVYYLQLKLDIALGVLKRGNKSISQIAFDLGFSDAFHFSNVFKKRFGYPPSTVEPIAETSQPLIREETE
ncbi:AraC family transcriptional regulator [Photobacterium sp. DA100]|uniref:AraC family transcriptional regulator n=1 Tax=Photobacterium sp. DA100 TaxID=3027472 RepID=UPI00247A36AB|nr:AraC family transcriptional regulator [Photobacterium sp. DA100]WEM41168.1 AraC family transcriptional regulator [Photobacterium sp. DA100]